MHDESDTPIHPGNTIYGTCSAATGTREAEVHTANSSDETSPLLEYNVCNSRSSACSALKSSDCKRHGEFAPVSVLPSWPHEAWVLLSFTAPSVVTFLLQHMVDVTSMIVVGKLGTVELAATSFASVSASITCFTVFSGLATSLDTLCAQAYGSDRKDLVGLYCQRMVLFLLCLAVPLSILWIFSEVILVHLVPDRETAHLVSVYLRVMVAAIPGFVIFECAKRFLQVQGEFRAITYCSFVVLGVHVGLVRYLVSHIGFIGVPIAVVVARTLQSVLLLLYIRFIKGSDCWGGFTRRALTNWGTMIRLAVPDMIMIEAEFLAFEIVTIYASRFGTEYLAAQSILTTITLVCFNVPFSMSIAVSTRVSQLIGAGKVKTAEVTGKLGFLASLIVGSTIFTITLAVRQTLPGIFSHDPEVRRLVAETLPILGIVIFVDGLCITAHGLLRGIGKQTIGGPVNLIAHYVISIPLATWLAFGLNWRLWGSYTGLLVGLVCVLVVECGFILRADWYLAVQEALTRNENA